MKIITFLSNKIPRGANRYVCQYLAAFTACLGTANSGMHYGWPSPSLPQLLNGNATSSITISSDEGSWVSVINLIGSVFGALAMAATARYVGRKTAITVSAPLFLVSWLMIAFGKNIAFLHTARFIAGLADGVVYTVTPMYVGEIASPAIRGLLGAAIATSWIFGILFINLIGSYTDISTAAMISAIFPILLFVMIIWMPESPYYLLERERIDKAKRSLQLFRGNTDIENEFSRISTAVKAQIMDRGSMLDLFTKRSNRRSVNVMLTLRSVQQLTGTAAISFYSQHIFEESGGNVSSKVASVSYFSVQLVLTLVSSSIVDKTGRRPLLLISVAGSICALFVEGAYFYMKTETSIDTAKFSALPVAALVIFVIFFSIGLQSVPVLMLSELFSPNVKASALCLADIYYSILATLVSKYFQITKDKYGMHVPFFTFGVLGFCGLAAIYMFTPETKGKTLEEIQEFFEGNESLRKLKTRRSISESYAI